MHVSYATVAGWLWKVLDIRRETGEFWQFAVCFVSVLF